MSVLTIVDIRRCYFECVLKRSLVWSFILASGLMFVEDLTLYGPLCWQVVSCCAWRTLHRWAFMLPGGLILCTEDLTLYGPLCWQVVSCIEDLPLYGPLCCQVVLCCALRTWPCMKRPSRWPQKTATVLRRARAAHHDASRLTTHQVGFNRTDHAPCRH